MAGVATVYRWELAKLRRLKRTWLGLGMAVLVPVLFVVAVHLRRHTEHGGGWRSPTTSTARGSRSRSSSCCSVRSGCSR